MLFIYVMIIIFVFTKIWFCLNQTDSHISFPETCGSLDNGGAHNVTYCSLVGTKRCESWQSIWGTTSNEPNLIQDLKGLGQMTKEEYIVYFHYDTELTNATEIDKAYNSFQENIKRERQRVGLSEDAKDVVIDTQKKTTIHEYFKNNEAREGASNFATQFFNNSKSEIVEVMNQCTSLIFDDQFISKYSVGKWDSYQFKERNSFNGYMTRFKVKIIDCKYAPKYDPPDTDDETEINNYIDAYIKQIELHNWCKNFVQYPTEDYQNINFVSILGFRDMDCADFTLFIARWLCRLLPDYPQDIIIDFYNCLNNNPKQLNIPEGNKVDISLNYGLYPLIKGGS